MSNESLDFIVEECLDSGAHGWNSPLRDEKLISLNKKAYWLFETVLRS